MTVTRSGLQLPQQLRFERWLAVGRELAAISTSAAWCLGDWLAFGEKAYPGRYRHAIEQTSLNYQTLRNYTWVARQFAMSRRRDTLTFGHHAEVAALPIPEQDFWLRKAEEHQWPVKQLRHQVRASQAERSAREHDDTEPGPAGQDWVILSLQIRLSPRQLDNCHAAASKANLSIEAWTAIALEHAARQQLDHTETPQPLPSLQGGTNTGMTATGPPVTAPPYTRARHAQLCEPCNARHGEQAAARRRTVGSSDTSASTKASAGSPSAKVARPWPGQSTAMA